MPDEELKRIQRVTEQSVTNMCENFCKFGKTSEDGRCIWCKMHADRCPLDDLLATVGLR